MEKKYKFKGTYSFNNNEEKDFEIEYDNLVENEEENNKLFQLLQTPLSLLKEGGNLGITGVKRFFTVLFLFAISNTILFFYSVIRLFSTSFEFSKIGYVFLIFILGVGITIYAAYRTYHYVIIDTLRVIYENLSSLFKKIAALIIDKVAGLFERKKEVSEDQLTKALDFKKMVNSKFQIVPNFLRKGIIRILYKIPFVGMILEVKDDIKKGNKAEASVKLYTKMDNFITEYIFGSNNTNWVWWVLPANIIVLFVLIKLKIG
jgi:hypothetical protein